MASASRAQLADASPVDEVEFLQMIDVEQLGGFGGGEIDALAAEEFERVPVGGVVAGADGDAARGIQAADGVLDNGGGDDAEVDHVAAAGQQAGNDALPEHDAAGARVASQDHGAARFKQGAEGGGKVDDMTRPSARRQRCRAGRRSRSEVISSLKWGSRSWLQPAFSRPSGPKPPERRLPPGMAASLL